MIYRHIGIDPSLSSSAICIMEKGKQEEFHVFTTIKSSNKWMMHAELFAKIHSIKYGGRGTYSDAEVEKLIDYRKNAYSLIDELKLSENDHVLMEGYAARAKGNIVDLVVFGTFIRERICDTGAKLTIVTPMSLKKAWAEAIYPKDKKGVARNYELVRNSKGEMLGVAGGSFTKQHMLLGLYEMEKQSNFKNELKMHQADIMLLKDIPKPFDDCVDAFSLAHLGQIGLL